MKVVSSDALTKLIQLSKDEFLSKSNTTTVTTSGIKTINGTSILGTGNIDTHELPSQTSQSGKFLTTNGTAVSWADIPTEIPSQSGQNGKFLTTNGTAVSWETVDALPTQAGNADKFLTTDGTNASWASLPTEVEWATYDTTTWQQVKNWYDVGRVIAVKNSNHTYILSNYNTVDNSLWFTLPMNSGGVFSYLLLETSNKWTSGTFTAQNKIPAGTAGNIVTYTGTAGIVGSATIDDIVPSQASQSGKYLTTDGTNVSWASFDESDLVHKSGDETITGTKSFESTLQLKNNLSFRSYGSNDSGRLQFRAQPSDNVIRGAVAITDGYSTSGSGYTGFVAQMVAREGSTTSEPFNTMRVSNKGIEYIKEANDGTITGQYILIGNDGIVPQARLASGGTNGQVLMTNGTTASWEEVPSSTTITYWEDD